MGSLPSNTPAARGAPGSPQEPARQGREVRGGGGRVRDAGQPEEDRARPREGDEPRHVPESGFGPSAVCFENAFFPSRKYVFNFSK